MSITKDTLLRAVAFLFPPACLSCNRLEGVRSLRLGLCSRCQNQLEVAASPPIIQAPEATPALDGLLWRWVYTPPFDAVVHGLKFGRLEYLGLDLADGLQGTVKAAERNFDVVVPIPLHWHRRLARGYNQAESIAKPLARQLGLPLVNALRRRRRTRAQTGLDRSQRELNLRLAFAPIRHRCGRIADRRLLLVDDVVTTGATMEAAARCLRELGARSVVGLAAGRTQLSNDHPEDAKFLTRSS